MSDTLLIPRPSQLDRETFLARYGDIYERSPWVAERAWETGLDEAYREKFGFPFVMAVKGSDRHAILDAFEVRLENNPEEERRTAIEQINRIARFRLQDRVA